MRAISNERLEEITNDKMINQGSEFAKMATELLALRKERERAEPVAVRSRWKDDGVIVAGNWKYFDIKYSDALMADQTRECELVYTAPPAPDERYQQLSELYHAQEKRLFKLAQRIKGPTFDKYAHSSSQAIDVLEAAVFGETDKPKSEMSQQAEQLLRDTTALAVTLSGETDTTSQQFESLAGKAVGRSDGFECTPVADLYELLTKCGECYDYTTSAKVAAAWIKDGYSAREYVKLDRLQEAMTQGSAGEGDGWIPCSERMPVEKDIVLVVDDGYFVCEAQYREGDFFSAVRGNNEFFETTCRDVEFWQPLPEPPCK
ncbi:DUF551 domain-containing protein [Cronobacter malonaticus]